jgi:TetR/AcrR family transcriptional regulator, transcriptional repressor of bet genes
LAPPPEAARAESPRRGRPSTGARERILEAGLEVLKADGYAGLTTAKVAARSGQNKALISYHFGSKQGLVAAVGREVGQSIADEVLGGLDGAETVEEIVRGVLRGLSALQERDERLPRLYFDLAAVSVVEPEVRAVMREIKNAWREVLREELRRAKDGPPPRRAEVAAVYVIAGAEGFALERLESGETPELRRAMDAFARTAPAAISAVSSA